MSDSMRDQIIQVLLSTRSMSEGDTADALLSLLASQPPAQAEPKCNCDMRTKLVGDGCSVCNPDLWAELLKEDEQPEPSPDTEQKRLDAGLPVEQEPKYTVLDGRIVNRASGDPIPDDEPVFIFRARDRFACDVLAHYCALLPNIPNPHLTAVFNRLQHFHRFAAAHPHRMKTPDTDEAAIEAEGKAK